MESANQPILRVNVDLEVIEGDLRLFRHDILSGKPWYIALLEAVARWTLAEETIDERVYRYLIGGEAFDWLLLAERLTDFVADLVPDEERVNLLFYGRPPDGFSHEQFKEMVGPLKYRGYLNYVYGITVEESLILATEEEVHKEHSVRSHREDVRVFEGVYQRIYGQTQSALLQHFREECGFLEDSTISLYELKYFTYWLFKYRVKRCHKARVASDTRKALAKLQSFREQSKTLTDLPLDDSPDIIELGQ
ncbi:MAG: hypothetical protein Q7O66_05510 [Dehalococcoidia bacterium]|nr:hypothetical protein [Dehalococcoidia bacterium]